jgi:hypothetical protein
VRGTRIRTTRSEVAIESLAIGDEVVTASVGTRPVCWIGRRRLNLTGHPDPLAVCPVQVTAGAFGPGLPTRDLWLSPGHNIVAEGVLMPIGALINGVTIIQHPCVATEYWHVELDAHDVIFAEGLPAESYLDTGNRCAFENGGAFIQMFPDFAPKHPAETCMPLVGFGPEIIRTKAALQERAGPLAQATTQDPDLHVIADGKSFLPARLGIDRYGFILPRGCGLIALQSRVFVPSYDEPACDDRRNLGVCVGAMQIDGVSIALAGQDFFADGWHKAEEWPDHRVVRWTTGEGCLPAGARVICIELAATGRYAVTVPEHVRTMAA